MNIKAFIYCRKAYFGDSANGKNYVGMLMIDNCIEIQTADYSNSIIAKRALHERMIEQGFGEHLGVLDGIKILDKFPQK